MNDVHEVGKYKLLTQLKAAVYLESEFPAEKLVQQEEAEAKSLPQGRKL